MSRILTACAAGAFLAVAAVRPADADVGTAFSDLRGLVEQKVALLSPDPSKKRLVRTLRGVSTALRTSKGSLSRDAKFAAKAMVGIENAATLYDDEELLPELQKLVDEFQLGLLGEQQSLQRLLEAMPDGGRRLRVESAALQASSIFGTIGEAPTQSARMGVLRRSAAAVEKAYRLAGARKGVFAAAVQDGTSFFTVSAAGTIGASGDVAAPHAVSIVATIGPARRAHRRVELSANLLQLGAGGATLGGPSPQNVGTIAVCPGGGGTCAESSTDAMHPGGFTIVRHDAGYRVVAGTFEFLAADGAGGTTNVVSGAFRVKYE